MKIGPISLEWQRKKASSNNWKVVKNPRGELEAKFFRYPEELIRPGKDTRERLLHINYVNEIRSRRSFALFAYAITLFWILNLIVITYLQGFGRESTFVEELIGLRSFWRSFRLSTAEFIAFVTTTTATVIGLSIIVGRYLYVRFDKDSARQRTTLEADDPATVDQMTAAGTMPNMSVQPPKPIAADSAASSLDGVASSPSIDAKPDGATPPPQP